MEHTAFFPVASIYNHFYLTGVSRSFKYMLSKKHRKLKQVFCFIMTFHLNCKIFFFLKWIEKCAIKNCIFQSIFILKDNGEKKSTSMSEYHLLEVLETTSLHKA